MSDRKAYLIDRDVIRKDTSIDRHVSTDIYTFITSPALINNHEKIDIWEFVYENNNNRVLDRSKHVDICVGRNGSEKTGAVISKFENITVQKALSKMGYEMISEPKQEDIPEITMRRL